MADNGSFPARGRGARDRFDEVMSAHLLEATVVRAVFAHEDRVHGRLHIVVDPPRAGTAEEGERLVMGVEDHLLRLSRIGSDEDHPAVAEPDMGDLHRRGHPVDQNDLVAPVELVGFARIEAQRHEGRGRRRTLRLRPRRCVAPHGVVAALVSERLQLLEDTDRRQPVALRLARVLCQHPVELVPPRPDLRLRLYAALVGELRRARPHDLPHCLARDPKLATDLLDRLLVLKVRPADLRDRFHHQHPKHGSRLPREHDGPTVSGGPFSTPITPVRGPFSMPVHISGPGPRGAAGRGCARRALSSAVRVRPGIVVGRDVVCRPEGPGKRCACGSLQEVDGGRTRIRTCDLWLRRPALYPAELCDPHVPLIVAGPAAQP